jgi:hypothetical protein
MTTTEALLDTIKLLNKHDKDFKDLCELILNASLLWTGEDEKKNPSLKTLRTKAGMFLNDPDYF